MTTRSLSTVLDMVAHRYTDLRHDPSHDAMRERFAPVIGRMLQDSSTNYG